MCKSYGSFCCKILERSKFRFQLFVMDKFLCHPLVKDFVPPYLENITNLKQNYEIVGNLKETVTFHLIGAH